MNVSRKAKPAELKILLKKLFEKDSAKLQNYMNNFKSLHPKIYTKYFKNEMKILNAPNESK